MKQSYTYKQIDFFKGINSLLSISRKMFRCFLEGRASAYLLGKTSAVISNDHFPSLFPQFFYWAQQSLLLFSHRNHISRRSNSHLILNMLAVKSHPLKIQLLVSKCMTLHCIWLDLTPNRGVWATIIQFSWPSILTLCCSFPKFSYQLFGLILLFVGSSLRNALHNVAPETFCSGSPSPATWYFFQ